MAIRSNLYTRINALLSTRQRQSYALIVITIFITFVLIVLGVFPIISSILFQVEQNTSKGLILEQMETKERNLRTLINTESQKHEVTLALDAALPNTLDQSGFLETINELVDDHQAVLVFASFADIQDRRILREIFNLATDMQGKTVTIGIYGSRAGLQSLLADIEELRRVANVLNFSLARRESNDIEVIPVGQEYSLTVQAEIYFTGD